MKRLLPLALVGACLPITACSETSIEKEQQNPSDQDLISMTIMLADKDQDGFLSRSELINYGDSVFASMDYDDDGSVSKEEFSALDFGFQTNSKNTGWSAEYEAARRILFAIKDRNGDAAISTEEQQVSSTEEFNHADLDGDDQLSKEESNLAHLPGVIFQAAKPDPD
ncbi:MAG: hypothetical protein ABJP02_09005 [Parasphingorhabdus sp.]|uniref:EF-hand domain-containing protein n=1 Tax=Parasphingorhabdus sp. TaxID=2709688 RepID=UPI00329A4B02